MMHDGKKIEKKKTEIHEKNLNPVFEETFMFTVPYERIRQTSLVVSVMDYDRMGRNEPIGQLILGNKSGVMEVRESWCVGLLPLYKQPIVFMGLD